MQEDASVKRSAEVLADALSAKLKDDPEYADQLKADPASVKDLVAKSVVQTDGTTKLQIENKEAERQNTIVLADKEVYVFAVKSLGAVSVLSVIAIMIVCAPQIYTLLRANIDAAGGDVNRLANISLAFSIPDGLIALGSAAIGALAGLLGPLSARK